jgi:hypothetical protein
MFDTVTVLIQNGVARNLLDAVILDFDMLVISKGYSTLPDRTMYSTEVRKLALGALNFNQTWLYFPPNPN